MTGGILALGPLDIPLLQGADHLSAAGATQGLPRLGIPSTERSPTPAHLLTADQGLGVPWRSSTADPHEERGPFLLADEVVSWFRPTVSSLMIIDLL